MTLDEALSIAILFQKNGELYRIASSFRTRISWLVAEIRNRYLTMRPEERQRPLAAYAHELTILARMHFADSEWEAARQCNELLHRIAGHLASPGEERDSNAARSFVEMMIHDAQARGWTPILHRTILGVTRQEARG